MAPRILYLATADARGHLMRAQLLAHALTAAGASVQVITTSAEGRRFLAGFGIDAPVLSHHYAVQFDAVQNMLRRETDQNVARYVFYPKRMLRDIARLRSSMRDADVVVNDSFHPALLTMGMLPGWRRKIVHVYGASLRAALEGNFQGRVVGWMATLFSRVIALQIASARARIEHDFAYVASETPSRATYRLPTPVAVAGDAAVATGAQEQDPVGAQATPSAVRHHAAGVAVYLNPHFRDPALADALQAGLAAAHVTAHCVGEGYEGRPGWTGRDERWVDHAARSDVIVSAPGMAALSIALVYGKPIVLVLTDQPEQAANAARATQLGLRHRVVVWRGADPASFSVQVAEAVRALLETGQDDSMPAAGSTLAQGRLDAWVEILLGLAEPPESKRAS
ncbi:MULTISPECIES: hypothetical protein [unclassified Achromobacter]|uniref:hypothetical protein n=1 Tax=unclassified Achromobacter TaxID=2626865 RepID=UPI000B51E55B|nr:MULTISPECIES: hypothetical protein [unclassified Achromobacter]OWT73661.1 hypothetical protein CEY05_21425 [Achromobacter sp. HZ34]OWT79423.1 hypothetical protein CEY04_10555 [Achromobacter sp. HZ28]